MDSEQKRSLAIAFRHVFESFGEYANEQNIILELPDVLNWSAVSGLDDIETGQYGTYPYSNPSIARFDDGSFHFVDSPADRTIIDSFDGGSKKMEVYGTPTAWATFVLSDAPINRPDPETGKKTGRWHKLKKGESLWQLSARTKVPVQELVDHNDILDPNALEEGTEIHIPTNKPDGKDAISYEVFKTPLKMHVSKEGGTKKWSFASVRRWADLHPTGKTFAQNTNVSIVAIAHVPIEGTKAAYYMDSHALGNYLESGRVAYTLGFNWKDLIEGEYTEPEPEVEEPTILDEPDLPTEEFLDELEEAPLAPNQFKSTYKPFDDGTRQYIISTPEDKAHIAVHDLGNNRPSRHVERGRIFSITGTFVHNGITYGRPPSNYWFGVPMDLLIPEDQFYNDVLEDHAPPKWKPSRQGLSKQEQTLEYIAKGISHYTKLTDLFNKRIKVKKEK